MPRVVFWIERLCAARHSITASRQRRSVVRITAAHPRCGRLRRWGLLEHRILLLGCEASAVVAVPLLGAALTVRRL